MSTARRPSAQWTVLRRQLIIRRQICGLSQREAARLAGIGRGTLSKIEMGARIPGVDVVIGLADAYGLKLTLTGL